MVKRSFFYQWVQLGNKKSQKILNIYWRVGIWLLVIGVLIFSFAWNNFSFYSFGANLFIENLKTFFSPINRNLDYGETSLWFLSLNFLFYTIKYLSAGTIIGFSLGFLTALLVWKNFSKWYYSFILKFLILGLRAFPVFVFLFAFKIAFSQSAAPLVIFSWFTWLWLHKYILILFNGCDDKGYWITLKKGYSRIHSFKKEILSRISNKLFLLFLFAFESNLRWLTILSSLGLLGIGSLISTPLEAINNRFNEILIPLFIIFLTLLVFEVFIFFFKELITNKTRPITSNKVGELAKKIELKRYIIPLTILVFLVLAIWSFFDANWKLTNFSASNQYLNQIFNFNWGVWSLPKDENPFYLMIDLLTQSVIIVFFSGFFGLLIGILSSDLFFNKYVALIVKIISVFFRIIPVIFLFYLFNPIFYMSINTTLFVLIIHMSFTFSKKIVESINNLSKKRIKLYKKLNYSWFWILRNYLFLSIKKDVFFFLSFKFENAFRNLILFGIFGGSIIGQKIVALEERNRYYDMGGYVWAIWIMIILIEIVLFLLHNQKEIISQINNLKNFMKPKFEFLKNKKRLNIKTI